jgi:hypothetical protein
LARAASSNINCFAIWLPGYDRDSLIRGERR